ncbi:DUF4275 family protein [Paenibacillus zanthoxyli]|uniref:DUF4275 family protein n=1 Tax=Paenibacillus zanthoxyli TaxID=369399 RepID=UPI0018DCE039|nr:DUF4275 family protein [Paenibacillus zanthoxyli]
MIALIDFLQQKNIKVTEINQWVPFLRSEWENNFTNHIHESVKKKIFLDQFLWHVFSYNKLNSTTQNKAKDRFNNQLKTECYLFFQHDDQALLLEEVKNMKAEDFDKESDIYITDKNFQWTYVKTHESQCGPYFYTKNE